MSLAPREQQVLARIEDSFRSTDPWLATMLATFTVATSRRDIPRWARQPPRRRVRHLIQLTVAVALIVASVALFSTLSHTSHSPAACGAAVARAAGCPRTGASGAGKETSGNADPLRVPGK